MPDLETQIGNLYSRNFKMKLKILEVLRKKTMSYSQIQEAIQKEISISSGALYNYIKDLVFGGLLEVAIIKNRKYYSISETELTDFLLGPDPKKDLNGLSLEYAKDMLCIGLDLQKTYQVLYKLNLVKNEGRYAIRRFIYKELHRIDPEFEKRYRELIRKPIEVRRNGSLVSIGYFGLRNEFLKLGLHEEIAKIRAISLFKGLKRLGVESIEYETLMDLANSIKV